MFTMWEGVSNRVKGLMFFRDQTTCTKSDFLTCVQVFQDSNAFRVPKVLQAFHVGV